MYQDLQTFRAQSCGLQKSSVTGIDEEHAKKLLRNLLQKNGKWKQKASAHIGSGSNRVLHRGISKRKKQSSQVAPSSSHDQDSQSSRGPSPLKHSKALADEPAPVIPAPNKKSGVLSAGSSGGKDFVVPLDRQHDMVATDTFFRSTKVLQEIADSLGNICSSSKEIFKSRNDCFKLFVEAEMRERKVINNLQAHVLELELQKKLENIKFLRDAGILSDADFRERALSLLKMTEAQEN